MKWLIALICLGVASSALRAQSTGEVEKKGQVSKVKLETVVSGHLTELNGKFKLRATEVTFEPGGFIGSHHHVGPGIRCVTSGELTYIQPNKTTIYREGECFFESGDVSHRAENRTARPTVLINFELLPNSWAGASAVPVPK